MRHSQNPDYDKYSRHKWIAAAQRGHTSLGYWEWVEWCSDVANLTETGFPWFELREGAFGFDEGPLVLGWTAGPSFDGWACPVIAVEVLAVWIKEFTEACAEELLRIADTGELIFDPHNYQGRLPEHIPPPMKPVKAFLGGRERMVYDFDGRGFQWQEFQLLTDVRESLCDLAEAVAPDCMHHHVEAAKAKLSDPEIT